MTPYVLYAGRELTGSSHRVVSFDLVKNGSEREHDWLQFDVRDGDPDVDQPNFWGYVAYLGSKFIENGQVSDASSGELYSPVDEAVERARQSLPRLDEPRVGQVCWRFDSPPYDADTSDDAFGSRGSSP